MVNLALRAARNAGQDLVRRLDRFDAAISTGQEKVKFIADCTIGLEKNIIFELKKSYPEHNYEGRETGLNSGSEGQPLWRICVIDDLDNFRVGIPCFAILIVCLQADRPEHTVILNPMNSDEFTASRGRGALLNNRRIRCGSLISPSEAIIGYTQPAGVGEEADKQQARIMDLLNKGYEMRNLGSNALSMAYVAADRFQAAALSNVDDISLHAAGLLAAEAGCLISTTDGSPKPKAHANLLVSNPRLLKAMVSRG